MTAQAIVDNVESKLRGTPAKVEQRRRIIAQLAEARGQWKGIPAGAWVPRHPDAVLTLDQTRMLQAHKRLQLKLLVLGHHVADVGLTSEGAFDLTTRELHELNNVERTLRWTKGGIDSTEIEGFIKACKDALSGRSPELQVQLQLVRLLANTNTATKKHEALRNLQPVLPFGFPTEIATAVTLGGNPGTGNMDILCRTRAGSRRQGGELIVMELKAPSITSGKVRGAFTQAIRYAAALTFEASAFAESEDGRRESAHEYRQVFSPAADDKPRGPLVAHATVVLPDSVEEEAMSTLREMVLDTEKPQVFGREMEVGVLLYKATKTDKAYSLDERSLRWVGPWRPSSAIAGADRAG
jgi:hypothetical protein